MLEKKDILYYKIILSEYKLKITKSRIIILRFFHQNSHDHFSVDDIYFRLKEEGYNIGIATLYRIVSTYSELSILSSLRIDDSSLYELNKVEHHDHMICIKCKKVYEFCDDLIEERQLEIVKKSGGVLKNHHMVLHILCKKCNE
jgi:Fur family transcriptional regulator, ferric uptake regulator